MDNRQKTINSSLFFSLSDEGLKHGEEVLLKNMMRKGQIQRGAKDAVTDRIKFLAEIFGVAALR